MADKDKTRVALDVIEAQTKLLAEILTRAQDDEDWASARERLKRWKERTIRLLVTHVSQREAQQLEDKQKRSWISGAHFRNLADEANMYAGFLTALSEGIRTHPTEVFDLAVPTQETEQIVAQPPLDDSKIFVIHGRDELNLLRLKELLLERWQLKVIVLAKTPGKGRTLIEKFEEEAQEVAFSFALLTPDDLVETGNGNYSQARPNAVFELGWFYGRLGRNRVCILFRQGTKIHSDLDGISRVEFSDSVLEKTNEIEQELLAAGILKRS